MLRISEEVQKIINEISDDLKASYLAGRQAQADKVLAKLDKARKDIRKSNQRQVAALPQGIDKETAIDALQELKYEMKKIDSGSDWRLEEQDNEMCLSTRYWGEWHGDDGSGDYDWQELDDIYRDKLNNILIKIQKKYGVQIYEPGSEKNWLDFCIPITKKKADSMFSYEDEKAWENFLEETNGKDATGPIQKKRGKLVADIQMFTGTGYIYHKNDNDIKPIVEPGYNTYKLHVKPIENNQYEVYFVSTGVMTNRLTYNFKGSFQDCLKYALEIYNERGIKKDKWVANKEKNLAKREVQIEKQVDEINNKLPNFNAYLARFSDTDAKVNLWSDKNSYFLWINEKPLYMDEKYCLYDSNQSTSSILRVSSLKQVIDYLNREDIQ